MKYRIETQQVFGSNGKAFDVDAEWLAHDDKPRGFNAAVHRMNERFSRSGMRPPIRVVAVDDATGIREEVARIDSPHKPVEPAVLPRRSLTADSAWFLVRTMGPVTGMNAFQIERFLRSVTIGRIEDDAEGIQQDFYSRVADKAQELLVGRPASDD